MKKLFLSLKIVLLAVLFFGFASGQTQDRVMFLERLCNEPTDESKDDESNCLVELIDIKIDGKKITSGKTFLADEKWLENLKIRIKNVSGKPFVAVGMSFGLIEGLHEEMAPNASWKWAFILSRGKSYPAAIAEVSNKIVLRPNQEIELTYSDLPELHKSLSEVLGKMSKIVFIAARVEFGNGEQEDSRIIWKNQR